MKKLLFLALAVASITSCKKDDNNSGGGTTTVTGPQITSSVVISSMLPNTKASGYTLDSGIIAFPVADTNAKYNYANVSDAKPWSDSIKTPNHASDYPTATYMTGVNQNLLGYNILFNQFFSINSSNWQDLGSYLDVPLNGTVTGYSITVPAQASKNNPARTLVNFPIQYGNSFTETTPSASINTTVAGKIKNPFGSVPDSVNFTTPLTITNAYSSNSKNISYGYIKLKGYTDSMAVVVQKYDLQTTTSVTTGSALYDGVLFSSLTSYGFTNGKRITNTTEYRFWAKDKGLIMSMGNNGIAYVRKL